MTLPFVITEETLMEITAQCKEQVAPWFAPVVNHPNVYLPESFWKVIKEKHPYIN